MNISRPFSFLLGATAFSLVCLFAGQTAQAAQPAGTLIKASQPAVYYVGADGKRHAFLDKTTYDSWYSDFNSVHLVSDEELANYSLGAAVTIRPGSRMVKIQTDPKVYVVARGGTLRWVSSEAVARTLFGENWNRLVSDVSDGLFGSYRVQSPIAQSSDFSPNTELSIISTIDLDLQARIDLDTPVPTPPILTAPTSTAPATSTNPAPATSTEPTVVGRIDLLTLGPISSGNTITVLTSVTRGLVDSAVVSFGVSSTASCRLFPCRSELLAPMVEVTTAIPLQAVFRGADGTYSTTTLNVTVLPDLRSQAIHLTAPTQVLTGTQREIRVDVDNSLAARFIRIFLDGQLVHECSSTQYCSYVAAEEATSAQTRVTYATVVNDEYQEISTTSTSFAVVR